MPHTSQGSNKLSYLARFNALQLGAANRSTMIGIINETAKG